MPAVAMPCTGAGRASSALIAPSALPEWHSGSVGADRLTAALAADRVEIRSEPSAGLVAPRQAYATFYLTGRLICADERDIAPRSRSGFLARRAGLDDAFVRRASHIGIDPYNQARHRRRSWVRRPALSTRGHQRPGGAGSERLKRVQEHVAGVHAHDASMMRALTSAGLTLTHPVPEPVPA